YFCARRTYYSNFNYFD
nr:immunoglobulin heavy chain junction region [Mus musculus]